MRKLPNGVVFGTRVIPGSDSIRMKMWLTNGSKETLSNLRVQNCIMLKGAPEFTRKNEEGTIISKPYIARRSSLEKNRWIITAWESSVRAWVNPPCPCMHSDPQFPDCKPSESSQLKGWLSFYEGTDIQTEIKRIEATGWQK